MEQEKSGAPGGIRTPDLLVRSQTLYPAELRAHSFVIVTQPIIFSANRASPSRTRKSPTNSLSVCPAAETSCNRSRENRTASALFRSPASRDESICYVGRYIPASQPYPTLPRPKRRPLRDPSLPIQLPNSMQTTQTQSQYLTLT
jgi:hypothetical protein